MGLNDTFTHVREQILLTDPIPSIDRVLSLTLQEEKHCRVVWVSVSMLTESTALFNKNNSINGNNKFYKKQRSRPIFTHCSLTGHTIEKCYKLHDYPHGYKQNSKTKMSSVNQAYLSSTNFNDASMNSETTPQFPFFKEQCCQLLYVLQNSLQSNQPIAMNVTSNPYFATSHFSLSGIISNPNSIPIKITS